MQNAKCRMQNAECKGIIPESATSPAHDHLAFCILHYVGRRSYGCFVRPVWRPLPRWQLADVQPRPRRLALFAAHPDQPRQCCAAVAGLVLSLIHISEPTRLLSISYAVFCLKK